MNNFFLLQNNKFYVHRNCIILIKEICNIIKFLCMRNYNIDRIQSFLYNYNRNPVTNNDNIFFTYDIHYDMISFQDRINEYQYNHVIYSIENLLSLYKNKYVLLYALSNLTTIMKRFAIHIMVTSTMRFNDNENTYVTNIFDKIKKEKRFIHRNLKTIIYRELYLAYLTIPVHISNLQRNMFTPENVVILDDKKYKFDLIKVSYFANDFIKDRRDLVSLSLCNKQLNQYFTVDYINSVTESNFKDIVENVYNLNFDQLNIELLKVNGIISGSTTLQCFYGNSKSYNENSDLDIYICQSNDIKSLVSYLMKNDYTCYKLNDVTNENPELVHVFFNYKLVDNIRKVWSFKHSITNRIVQLIRVQRNEISNVKFGHYVTSTFDISFVRNYWNGKYLTTYFLRDIMSKSGTINGNVLLLCSYDNYFYSNNDDYNIIKYFDSKTIVQIRILKYTERGFKIFNPLRTSLFY